MQDLPPSDDKARVEELLRDAHILRMRGQWAAAEDKCRQALELDPDDLMGREMLGDLLAEKGSLDGALEAYRAAFEKQPEKAALEQKLARIVLLKGEEEHERLQAQLFLSAPKGKSSRQRSGAIAVLLSMVCPGAGQIFNGQHVKGGILLGAWLLTIFGWGEALKLVLGFAGVHRGEANGPLAFLGLLSLLIWLYGLLDASSQAGKARR